MDTIPSSHDVARSCPACGATVTTRSCRRCELPAEEQPAEPLLLGLHAEPAPPTPRRRRGLRTLAGLTAAAVLAAGGWYGAGWAADGDVRSALDLSTEAMQQAASALRDAGDAEAVVAAAAEAVVALDTVERAERRVTGRGALEDAVRGQLAAEQELLGAVAALKTIATEPLPTWAGTHDDLTDALDAERLSREQLARQRPRAAAALPDLSGVLDGLSTAVGPALAQDAAGRSQELLADLDATASTADLRALASERRGDERALLRAAAVLPSGQARQALEGYAATIRAAAELREVSGRSPDGWVPARASLSSALQQVAAAAADDVLATRVPAALSSVDEVVEAAAAVHAAWRAERDAAIAARTADSAALDLYATDVRAAAATYDQARGDLAAHLALSQDPATALGLDEVLLVLDTAALTRLGVHDALVAMTVPTDLTTAHTALVENAARATALLQAARAGLLPLQTCVRNCPDHRELQGWNGFVRAAQQVDEDWSGVLATWRGALGEARAETDTRPLPPEPEV